VEVVAGVLRPAEGGTVGECGPAALGRLGGLAGKLGVFAPVAWRRGGG
jgi:hypothetical protein